MTKSGKLLRDYLNRYGQASGNLISLERRLARISGVTKGASIEARRSEYRERIVEQKKQAEDDILKVLDILDFLEPHSMERQILELRHIDCLSWERIPAAANMSRSSCFDYYNKGITALLRYKRVRAIIERYEEERTRGV